MLEVADRGSGMSQEVKAQVFEPFFTTKQTGSGSGLGLSMVYGFVRQSGGRVEIESAPGRGNDCPAATASRRCSGAGSSGSGSATHNDQR